MTLYFAYGSNMDRAGMRQRCPGAQALGTARLSGWGFLISADGYASIAELPGARVFGVLWQLEASHLVALDAYESLETGLYRRCVLPVQAEGRQHAAQVYVGRTTVPGRPRPGHLALVVTAAQSWGLPSDYVAELRRWSEAVLPQMPAPDTGAAQ